MSTRLRAQSSLPAVRQAASSFAPSAPPGGRKLRRTAGRAHGWAGKAAGREQADACRARERSQRACGHPQRRRVPFVHRYYRFPLTSYFTKPQGREREEKRGRNSEEVINNKESPKNSRPWGFGGRGWIRTIEAKTQQIYSLPPLATREFSHIQL